MARIKQYKEEEVIKKAMNLFWRNGFEATSVRMLEKEMGINQFSIYSSFGNKQGVFVESIKAYKTELNTIRVLLKNSNNGIVGIKQFFYDFLEFTRENEEAKGCLVCNSLSELGKKAEPDLMAELMTFPEEIKALFTNNLKHENNRTDEVIEKEANFLTTSILGLSVGSRVQSEAQLKDYVEMIFDKL